MKIAFFRSKLSEKWGGDLKILQQIMSGMQELGHKTQLTGDLSKAFQSDFFFFAGTNWNQLPHLHATQLFGKEYGSIPFYEDRSISPGWAFSFFEYLIRNIYLDIHLDEFWQNPNVSLQYLLKYHFLDNSEFLEGAKVVIANSAMEARSISREAPKANVKTCLFPPGFAAEAREDPSDAFLKFTGLEKGSYILQVGRIEPRKNQLATLLACKDLDLPLVFIAPYSKPNQFYLEAFLMAAHKWCKSRVYLISEKIPKKFAHHVRFIPMPDGKILPRETLLSAFAHAGLYLHPSFLELPGLVLLEASRFGIPVIASNWCSIRDYGLGNRIDYTLPHDVPAIRTLIPKRFGQFHSTKDLPSAFFRKPIDLARDILETLTGVVKR